jgi:hypothetical protein
MSTGRYYLRGHNVEPSGPDDLLAWAKWFESEDHQVALDETPDGVIVSTVFLGVDLNFRLRYPRRDDEPSGAGDRPLVFETKCFLGGGVDREALDYERRYATWDEAIDGHARALAWAVALRAARPGEIDRTTEHEAVPFMTRVETPEGVARELMELHRLVVTQRLLPAGSDVAVRFSLVCGLASGTIWRLIDRAKRETP